MGSPFFFFLSLIVLTLKVQTRCLPKIDGKRDFLCCFGFVLTNKKKKKKKHLKDSVQSKGYTFQMEIIGAFDFVPFSFVLPFSLRSLFNAA